ncbi:MAG: hypothetical protein ACREES_08295 [Stellaceae bacterium]
MPLTAEQIAAERARLVAEAQSWVGTPYHTGGRIKGVGVDCLTFVVCAFEGAALIAPYKIPHYPPDWHLHRDDERYMRGILEHCVEVAERPLPADVVLWKFGRAFAHGAIVIDWPIIVHAELQVRRVIAADALRNARMVTIGERVADQGKPRPRKVFRLKQWAAP